MIELYEKMILESINAQKADIETIKKNRGTEFKIKDAEAYANAVSKMEAIDGQSESVINLHKNSVKTHFETLNSLTSTIKPDDDPFVEHYQTPPILEILSEEDKSFADSLEKFIEKIKDCESIISKEVIRRYGGFYGPTCVVDFGMIPGSVTNIVNQILIKTDIPEDHKKTILSAKSWGMNTSYGFGDKFANELESGKTASEAIDSEIKTIQNIYRNPIEAQTELMNELGQSSFKVDKYMNTYKKGMYSTVKDAMDDGVHYGNIVTVPAYCVGDIGHHIGQSTYNMCKDDVVMEILDATTNVIENSLTNNVSNIKSPNELLSLSTGSSACATEYILELDGFNAPMVIDLLTKRFHNYVLKYPTRAAAAELHNCDFMDMIYRGYNYLDKAGKARSSSPTALKPLVSGHPIDLDPIHNSEVLMNPQRYTYPACGITVRFSSLMRLADYPCLLTSEPITATMMTNIIALNKDKVGSPVRGCKNCAACMIDSKHHYCQWKEAV